MGFWNFIRGKDENIDDMLSRKYGKNVISRSYSDIRKTSKLKFKETLNINDQIIEMYSKKNKDDIQNELFKKYLNMSRDQVNSMLLEDEKIDEEVDKTLDGVDRNKKEEVKKQVKEDNKKEKNVLKDKENDLKSKIYKAMYSNMYKDYTNKVLQYKDNQFDDMDIALGEKQSVEIMAYEKNLEGLELRYYNTTGKNFTTDKKINKQREEFKSKSEYNQKGIENTTDDRIQRINRLYAIREAKYREYINALTDERKSPQEKAMYKKDYEEANYNLIQNVPSLQEYNKELQSQQKSEDLARKSGLENKSAINSDFNEKSFKNSGRSEKVTESNVAEYIDKSTLKQQEREIKNLEYANNMQENELDEGNVLSAHSIQNAQESKNISNKNINETPQKNVSDLKEDVRKNEEITNKDFISSLRSGVKSGMTVEEAKDEIEDEIKERNYKENVRSKQEEYVIQRKRPNNKK